MKSYLTFDDVGIIPKYSEIESRSLVNLSTRLTRNHTIGIPIISAPMDTVTGPRMAIKMMELGGCGALHRFEDLSVIEEQVAEIYRHRQSTNVHFGPFSINSPICASMGVTGNILGTATRLYQAGANIILLDVAHGHHKMVGDAIVEIKSLLGDLVDIIAGNVSTRDGCRFLEDHGADAIRFGQGNGSLCETRLRTGIGIPQISGLMEAADSVDIPIIADGGIRYIGDVAKALVAGADSVMLGSLLAGTQETPGDIMRIGQWPNEDLF